MAIRDEQADPRPLSLLCLYRVSNDKPIFDAFWKTAPSVRLSRLAIFRACCFPAIDFMVRRSVLVHLRLVMVYLHV